jgi:hypothetical protein
MIFMSPPRAMPRTVPRSVMMPVNIATGYGSRR